MANSQIVVTKDIHPSELLADPGFNIRDAGCDDYFEIPEVRNHIESICFAYKRGEHVAPIAVEIVGNNYLIRQGHCRHRGLMKALKQGAAIDKITVIVLSGSEDEMYLQNITGNSGLKLNVVALSKGCYEMINRFGYSREQLAIKLNNSITAINNFLTVHSFPDELKAMIVRNEVSYTFALKVYATHKETALSYIKDALTRKAEGKKIITSKSEINCDTGEKPQKNPVKRKIASLTDKDLSQNKNKTSKKNLVKTFIKLTDQLGFVDDLAVPEAGMMVTIDRSTLIDLIALRKELTS